MTDGEIDIEPGVTDVRWAMSTHGGGGICMLDGVRVSHSHYGWAVSDFWKDFGDFLSRPK